MPTWAHLFLSALKLKPNVSLAADAAGIERTTAYYWRNNSPEFAAAWDQAIDRSLDELEESVFTRAKNTSDVLAIFLLKSHRPERYAEKLKIEHSGEIQIEWGDPQGQDAASASRPATGTDAPGTDQDPGVRETVG